MPDAAPSGPILITGASGFVGRHLTAALRAHWPDAEIATPATDMTDRDATSAMVREIAPEICIHLAAIASIRGAAEDHDKTWQINLHGTLNLAGAILDHVPACQFLHISSADAYGSSFAARARVDETAPLAPINLYGATKAAADLALGSMAQQGLRVVRLRPFNHIGIGQSPEYVVASFARQAARIAAGLQPRTMQVGRLDTRRDFLDVRDVCAAYVSCIAHRNDIPPGSILNIASGHPRLIGDILHEIIEIAGISADIQTEAPRLRAIDIPTAAGDATRARTWLDWSPKVPWRATLRNVFEDWRARVHAE